MAPRNNNTVFIPGNAQSSSRRTFLNRVFFVRCCGGPLAAKSRGEEGGHGPALGASGGVRPDADLQNIFLQRDGVIYQLDLASIVSGTQFTPTPSLNNGDVIFVESTGIENRQLIRPSQITPPGMRVFMSNLTAPALNNAQSAVGADATRLPYGASLLDSAISANCVGGTQMANASRSIVMITRNYGSNQQLAIKRSINELLANSSDASINPFVMPNDGVACYDSKFTNFRDVARGIGEVISPIIFGGLL